jgi:hypothetical protein
MNMSLRIFRCGKIQAWLLPIAVVFSLFAFSGSATPTAARRTVITEQVVPIQVSGKRHIAFKIKGDLPVVRFDAAPTLLHALRHCERSVKIQITQCLPGPIVFPESGLHQSPYTFHTDEDSTLFTLG